MVNANKHMFVDWSNSDWYLVPGTWYSQGDHRTPKTSVPETGHRLIYKCELIISIFPILGLQSN